MSPHCEVFRLWQYPLGDELVVARHDVQGLFLLNGTARFLWDEYNDGAALAEAVRSFANRYGVPPDLAKQDVEAAIAGWSQGLLSPARSSGTRSSDPSLALRGLENNSAVVGINCLVNGRGFRILLDPGDLVDEIAPRLAPIAVRSLPPDAPFVTFALANGEDRVFVFRERVCIAEEEKTAGARAILLQEMTVRCDPERETAAILHAGACGTASDCVILAGATHSGKSTLCTALMAGGLYCYSDDSAVLDRKFKVSGMPFPLTLRESSWPVIDSRFPSFIDSAPIHQRLGWTVRFLPSNLPANSSPSVTPRALVFVDYQPDASTTLQRLTPFEALMELQQCGFWVEHDRDSIARFLAWIGRLDCCRLSYSLLDEASDAVRSLLS